MPDITATMTVDEHLDGYLALPTGAGPWPGVVVLPEAFGLNDDIRRVADRFAGEGYVAFAPALYSLRCVRRAFAELSSGEPGPVGARIEASRAWLAGRDDSTGRVGVAGFCLGGGFALLSAPRYDFDAAAVNYGSVPADARTVLRGSCPIVASYGGRDRAFRPHVARLRDALEANATPHDLEVYPGAGHSFLNEQRLPGPASSVLHKLGFGHDPEAAADAWRRIFAFFADHLAGPPTSPAGGAAGTSPAGGSTPAARDGEVGDNRHDEEADQ